MFQPSPLLSRFEIHPVPCIRQPECFSSRINVILDGRNDASRCFFPSFSPFLSLFSLSLCFFFFFFLSLFLFVSDETGLFCSTSPSCGKWKLDPDENLPWSLADCWHRAPRFPRIQFSEKQSPSPQVFSHNDVCALMPFSLWMENL